MIGKSRVLYAWTVVVWSALVIAHAVKYLHDVFGTLPSNEVYANTVGFQLTAFVITQLPYWIAALVFLLLLEFVVLGRRK